MTDVHQESVYRVYPIGYVRHTESRSSLELLEAFRAGLKELNHFSHILVLWWADRQDNGTSRQTLECEPPHARGKVTGVFATRSESRPNPIALTTCKILGVNEVKGVIDVVNIDAFEGTPVLDLKPYFPVCDRVRNARIPGWLTGLPEWLPEGGLGI